MSKFQDFLNQNTVDNLTTNVVFSERLKDQDGQYFTAKIKAMTDAEFEAYRKASMTTRKNGKFELDLQQFNSKIIIGNTLDPNFKDAESIKAHGCTTPQQYLSKVLLAGEIAELSKQIQQFSGFDTDFDTLKEEVKN
ncbi:phage tail assembly chaperone [Amphibacillus sediminis]|uniref:phage tail assembly chaperone n=1 Tax=Amphibacillus sediminis TaxID=360185 RepID=UPI000834143D|nr:XkdN-like protein [Amphibacillus sediminis]